MTATVRSPLSSPAGARARLAASLTRLATRRDDVSRRLRRALWTTLAGRRSAGEREWIARIEARRTELLADEGPTGPSFEPQAEGRAGKFTMGHRDTTVAVASEFMSLPPIWSELLMRLVAELEPRSCLELGTAFGISTAYQAAALELSGSGSLTTIEGSPRWAEIAKANLRELGLERVTVRVGSIEEALPAELDRSGPIDFVFIDAEHQCDPTLEQFGALVPRLAPGAVMVLDDVDWPEMKRAHAAIAHDERISASLTLGRFGVSILCGSRSGAP